MSERDAFGHWLSGFTDGEGCFWLAVLPPNNKKRCSPELRGAFQISLRRDDESILHNICSFWNIGSVTQHGAGQKRINEKPSSKLVISNIGALESTVISHFERYPLRAKKRNDFEIWKEGIHFLYRLTLRKRPSDGRRFFPKYSVAELAWFRSLSTRLREQRRYENSTIILKPPNQIVPEVRQSFFW
jgi:hypothetical protein